MTVSSSMNPLCKYRHIIWDWNGTLLDDAWLCVEVINRILTSRGMNTTTLCEYQEHFDFPVMNYYLKLGFDFSVNGFDEVAQQYIKDYESQLGRCRLQDRAVGTIEKFRNEGLAQSVLSACQSDSLNTALEAFGLKGFFEDIAGLDDYYAHSKVDVGKKLLKSISTSPEEILLIGDTTHDYEVSQQMGIDCVLIPAGHQSKRRLLACGAKVCDSFKDLIF
jgi:phosphoglycolate phosphatase